MTNNKFTPETIGDLIFNIPIYQRLFEWEDEQVNKLLSDLFNSFIEDRNKPYYIGVLTVFKEAEKYSLVDGQQRFTVLMLLGIVLEWKAFLTVNNQLRLSFFARKNDEIFLKSQIGIEKSNGYINNKMKSGINTIKLFFENKKFKEEFTEFKSFIENKTTFFLSELPPSYSPVELNRYFEAMNEAGKGLENHEILKVRLLKELNEEDFDLCAKIWNVVAEMDKCLLKQKEDESNSKYQERLFDFFKNQNTLFETVESEKVEKISIKGITASSKKPNQKESHHEEKSIIDFQDFLLLVLSLTLNKNSGFEKNKLLESFKALEEDSDKIKSFFNNLLKYRLLFDYFIIRATSSDGRSNTYFLNYKNEDDRNKKASIHYQCLLNVSTSYNVWLAPLLKHLKNAICEKSTTNFELLDFLKEWDNERQLKNIDNISLKYPSINRYWFWRLDYYLWERREELFNEESKGIANQYIFRSNRSIEHVSPQNPKSESKINLNELLLHCFGNLAMISSGQNSSLQNESYEVKMAHVNSFINGSIGGSIESLKLLKIKEYETWNEHNIMEHHNQMIDVLKDSFNDTSIENKLVSLKIDINAI
jgi:hypothetical protein